MKKLIVALFTLLISSVSYAENPVTNSSTGVPAIQSVLEELTLNGQFCVGIGGDYGPWRTLYVNGNQVKMNEEVLVELNLNGASLTQWEVNPHGGNATFYMNDLNLGNGTIRFTPQSGNVLTFFYTLEKAGSVKEGSCSFTIR